MGVPGKTSGHSIQIVLGGSKKNRGLNPNNPITKLNPGQKALAKDGPDGLEAVAAMENKSVEEVKTMVNRAGSPARMMNNNMINQTEMGQMPFQNNAIVNAQGMKQYTELNPNIPGALPGSGNVPGNQYVPNPVARVEEKPKVEEEPKVKGVMLPELEVNYSPSGSGYSYNTSTGEERASTKAEMEEQRKTNMSKGDGNVTTSYVDPETGERKKLGRIVQASF